MDVCELDISKKQETTTVEDLCIRGVSSSMHLSLLAGRKIIRQNLIFDTFGHAIQHTRKNPGLLGFTWIHSGLLEFTQVYSGLVEFTRMNSRVHCRRRVWYTDILF